MTISILINKNVFVLFLCQISGFTKFKKYLEITRRVIKENLLSATIHLDKSEFSTPKYRKNLDVDSSPMNP